MSPATKLGDPLVLNITGGNGTDTYPYTASLGPFSQARVIAVTIQATGGAGGVATTPSDLSQAVVVGEWLGGALCRAAAVGRLCQSRVQHHLQLPCIQLVGVRIHGLPADCCCGCAAMLPDVP